MREQEKNNFNKTNSGNESKNIIPPQYRGLPSEIVENLWAKKLYVDPKKTKEENARREAVLEQIRKIEKGNEALSQDQAETQKTISSEVEARKKLSGWRASFELAKIAAQEGLNLANFSREDYANYAIKNLLKIDDNQLRMAPWERMMISAMDIKNEKDKRRNGIKDADKAFQQFSFEMKELSKKQQNERFLDENIRILSGTKDSDSWLHFAINNAKSADVGKTYKSYIALKDLNKLNKENIVSFMKELRESGYKGQLKIFQDLEGQGLVLNDQIVMHGNTEEDASIALRVAENFFGSELDSKSMGADDTIDGKNMSYSQILANKISEEIDKK